MREIREDWGWKRRRRRRRRSTSGSATPGLIDRIWKCWPMLRDGAPKQNTKTRFLFNLCIYVFIFLFLIILKAARGASFSGQRRLETRTFLSRAATVARSGAAAYGRLMSSSARGEEWGGGGGPSTGYGEDQGWRWLWLKTTKGAEEEVLFFLFFTTTLHVQKQTRNYVYVLQRHTLMEH